MASLCLERSNRETVDDASEARCSVVLHSRVGFTATIVPNLRCACYCTARDDCTSTAMLPLFTNGQIVSTLKSPEVAGRCNLPELLYASVIKTLIRCAS
jgi:hypothetical protein